MQTLPNNQIHILLNQTLTHKIFGKGKIIEIIDRDNENLPSILIIHFENDNSKRKFTLPSISPFII